MASLSSPLREADFRALFESAPDLYLVLNPDLTILAASDAYLSATMTRREEIIGRSVFEVFPNVPHDPSATGVDNLRASLDRVFRKGLKDVMAIQKYDVRGPEVEGGGFEERYWSPVNTPVFGPDKEIRYLLHRVEDVTEFVRLQQQATEQSRLTEELRRRTEQLADSEARKSAILRVSMDAIITMDQDGKVRGFNGAAETIFGYPEADVLGKPLVELIIPPALRPRFHQGLARYLDTGENIILDKRLEMRAMRADGSEFSAELTVTRIPVDGPPMFSGYLRDITERKRSEEAIREREERIRLILNSTAEAICAVDLQGNCTFCNRACARLLGYADPAELLGRNMHALVHPADPERASRMCQALQRGEGIHGSGLYH